MKRSEKSKRNKVDEGKCFLTPRKNELQLPLLCFL